MSKRRTENDYVDKHRKIVDAGGGEYVRSNVFNDRQVMFNSPATGSTLLLSEKGLTPDAVREHIKESNAKFGVAPPGSGSPRTR